MLTSRDDPRALTVTGVDLQILEALQADGRITANQLATRLGISRATAARRLAELLADEMVRVVGIVHPQTLGIASLAHISLEADRPVRRVAELLADFPEIPYVSLTSGAFPLIAEVRTGTDEQLSVVLDQVRGVAGVRSTETLTYTSLLVDVLRPTGDNHMSIDRVDAQLLSHLQTDGRATFTNLAQRVGVSTGTARTRVLRMIDDGVVRIGAIIGPGRGNSRFDVGVGISLRGPASVGADLLAQMSEVRFLAATLGRYDLLATIHADSLGQVVSILDRLRALRPVLRIDSWVHLESVKESYYYPMEALAR